MARYQDLAGNVSSELGGGVARKRKERNDEKDGIH